MGLFLSLTESTIRKYLKIYKCPYFTLYCFGVFFTAQIFLPILATLRTRKKSVVHTKFETQTVFVVNEISFT